MIHFSSQYSPSLPFSSRHGTGWRSPRGRLCCHYFGHTLPLLTLWTRQYSNSAAPLISGSTMRPSPAVVYEIASFSFEKKSMS
ncbi:hypothetical protein VTN00DRAFT_4932 [Thermoascus crustaceus]|uniref:uncharacterized protein n=1 Tax=Thermoascus crustaceus TaxID=5088 RepID=UPI003742E96B